VSDRPESSLVDTAARLYIRQLQALDRLVDATQRVADAEALSRFVNTFPAEGFHPAPTITRENVLSEIAHRDSR
jgi:hypothetical protein